MKTFIIIHTVLLFFVSACHQKENSKNRNNTKKIDVIFDTDANNELDDQHALAYLLFSGNTFHVAGVSVNATHSGGEIANHYAEAKRVMQLCDRDGKIPLLKGANENFNQITPHIKEETFDGSDAVNFIISKANARTNDKLVLLAVGKLTNLALAFYKEPSITEKVKVVWLGSNYPDPGEYNLENDTAAVKYVLSTPVEFEMVTVRYGKPTGTDAVRATKEEIERIMPGKGPRVSPPVMGRHGIAFDNFGSYSVNLFAHIDYDRTPPSRALFDMAAVAIVKDPSWAQARTIPCPLLKNNQWVDIAENPRTIILWENFDRDKIMEDFYTTMSDYQLAE